MVIEEVVPQSLVLYKQKPAIVLSAGKKVSILNAEGERLTVRPKDLVFLHPGPINNLEELSPQSGDVRMAWEILQEEWSVEDGLDLRELSQFIFGDFTPSTAWATWEQVADGHYFSGQPDSILLQSPEKVEGEFRRRAEKAAEALAWEEFLSHVHKKKVHASDLRYLREVEDLALSRRENSQVLAKLGKSEHPEVAHAFLLELSYWKPDMNPYPQRLGVSLNEPVSEMGLIPMDDRIDLTHLEAFAIDDVGNQDPDDALSLDDNRLWVHVADVASVVNPNSDLDQEARERGATLYLPEKIIPMLPRSLVSNLGLGLSEVSPALSFGIDLGDRGDILDLEIVPSLVRVHRLTYEEVEKRLDDHPFQGLERISQVRYERRSQRGAFTFDFPEVKLNVVDGVVALQPILPLRSRNLVREAMLLAGEVAARFALDQEIPFPYVNQEIRLEPGARSDRSSTRPDETDLAAQYHQLRQFSPSQVRTTPGPHDGVGLPIYSRVTSPLRRYADLLAHQQLRSFSGGGRTLEESELVERIAAGEAAAYLARRAESASIRHWTLVYLLQHPNWEGDAIVVARRGSQTRLMIPELALETSLHLTGDWPINTTLLIKLKSVNLPDLEAYFEVID